MHLIDVNPGREGKGVRVRGGDLMPETIPYVGLLIVRSDPGVRTFDFDRQKPYILVSIQKRLPSPFLEAF